MRDVYGLVVFAQAMVSYFLIIVEFGLNLSATKELSIYRFDKERASYIVSSVLIVKGVFFIIFLILLYVVTFFVKQTQGYELLFFLSMHVCLYEWLFLRWYFQGVERMKYITIIVMVSRLVFLGLILFFVKKLSDYLRVSMINSFGALLSGIVSLWIVLGKDKVVFSLKRL